MALSIFAGRFGNKIAALRITQYYEFFRDPAHHGEPEFRSAMVPAGYEAGGLDLESASLKGRKMSNLAAAMESPSIR